MDKYLELLQEISDNRNDKKSEYIENLINDIIENGGSNFTTIENKYHCSISFSKEKHNSLQFTEYYTITSRLIKNELNLEVENGINNGTMLREYSFSNSLIPTSRTINVLSDVELDEIRYEKGLQLLKAKSIFSRYKDKIITLINRQSYDDYVTGGGSNITDKYYKTEFDKIAQLGLFWNCVYKEQEIDINLV